MTLLALATVAASAQERKLGEKVYKEVFVDSKAVNKWVELDGISEYDKNGNVVHERDSISIRKNIVKYIFFGICLLLKAR